MKQLNPHLSGKRRFFFNQVWILTISNLKTRYRKTWAGFFWVVMNPIITLGVQCEVFKHFLKLDISMYPLYLLSGLLPWIFTCQCLEMCTPIILFSGRLLKSYPVHPLVFLSAQMLDNLINALTAYAIVLIPFVFLHPQYLKVLPLTPLAFLPLAVGTLGASWFLSTLNVFFRDTRFILSFGLQLAFYLTPIFYTSDFIPQEMKWLMKVNPFYYWIDPFHKSVYDYRPHEFWVAMAKASLLSVSVVVCGLLYWKKKKNEVLFHV